MRDCLVLGLSGLLGEGIKLLVRSLHLLPQVIRTRTLIRIVVLLGRLVSPVRGGYGKWLIDD